MTMKRVFKSSLLSSVYLFKNGNPANFINGEYYTNIEEEVAELENEVRLGHPHIYMDPNRREVDTDKLNPIEEIKRQAVEEYLAKVAAGQGQGKDMGTSLENDVRVGGIGNTHSLGVNSSAPPVVPTETQLRKDPLPNESTDLKGTPQGFTERPADTGIVTTAHNSIPGVAGVDKPVMQGRTINVGKKD